MIRFDAYAMRMDQTDQVCAWLRSLGLNPDDIRSTGLIVKGERSYLLHLSQVVRDDDGDMVVDHAANDVVSTPLVVDLGPEESWPSWLGE